MDLLIRAFAGLLRSGLQATLTAVGAGPELERLRGIAVSENAMSVVAFGGPQTRNGVREEMWRANALILSSDFETFGVVLVEALSTGLPVVATRCGGPAEIVRSAHGCLIDPGDVHQLTSAMRLMMHRRFEAADLRSYAVRHLQALYRHVLSAGTMMRSSSINRANWSGYSDCAPSQTALSGS